MQEELLGLWAETKMTLVFVTHSIDEAITLGTRIVLLSPHPGQVVDELSVDWSKINSRHPEFAELKEKITRILFKDQMDFVI
jgi:NitT/TauT family transport system ATP-binding protein